MSMLRIAYREMQETLTRILIKYGLNPDRAGSCSRLFTETTCDGVYSHGLNRFPRFIKMIVNGSIRVDASPIPVLKRGALERWDGGRGPGNLNAYQCMDRAIELSRGFGVGCVALANTNHWMRGGSYGWQAADAGVIGICWTNTMPNLPPWGATEPRLGNNPLVIAIPRTGGHVVLDMAMSQFSYGALASYRAAGLLLPVEGGFDTEGNLTQDPAAIECSQRPLPIGYWKGSGLALTLDMIAAMLSAGLATYQIPGDELQETGISQIFLAFNLASLGSAEYSMTIANQILDHLQANTAGNNIRYPGEQILKTRAENCLLGIPADPAIWAEVQKL